MASTTDASPTIRFRGQRTRWTFSDSADESGGWGPTTWAVDEALVTVLGLA